MTAIQNYDSVQVLLVSTLVAPSIALMRTGKRRFDSTLPRVEARKLGSEH